MTTTTYTLKYDAEFAKALEPFLPALAGREKPKIHDLEARIPNISAFVGLIMSQIPEEPDVESEIHHTTAEDGHQVPVHVFRKKKDSDTTTTSTSTSPTAAVLHVHGGGMFQGSPQEVGKAIARYVGMSSIPFFSVDYRLAPAVTATTLVDDSYAGLLWLHQNASKFNVDPARIIVMGESAGGGIAAGVALKARDEGLSPPLAKQLLVYPMLDDRNNKLNTAMEPLAFWQVEDNITGWSALLGKDKAGDPGADVSYYAAPARAPSLKGLPPTYIDVGSLDYFRDEDLAFAGRLAAENIETEFHLYPGVPHGFEGLAPNASVSLRAATNRLKALMSV
ncbi:hypothetical protein PV10_04530 [Exophiala mesophila]|uniref:Alpha/beta hydrolase fold-3 domain-containing protein n=1 Tax=Exophiala mesophila TaxID=212818 RepID=A0A0D1XYG9_EXOME|nr:uncharacterized protein PV10_04530 [Exophiala mesophila]KIV93306.1 hypothetical protein PV10_04530 [Exophiala mesophila]